MSFVIIPKKDPKKLQNLWAPSLTTVHISLVGWDQGDSVNITALSMMHRVKMMISSQVLNPRKKIKEIINFGPPHLFHHYSKRTI